VADWLVDLALAKAGPFSICLSGGSTPKLLYQRLAEAPWRDRMPWERTHLFWGDERFVAPEDARSNYRMVREALLDHVPIPPDQIHPFETEAIEPGDAATHYEQILKSFHKSDALDPARPLFDVVLLGLGPDGHTASLFPGTSVLSERVCWASEAVGPQSETRLTLTYPALESAANAAFLVAGEDKRAILRRLLSGDMDLPATRYRPVGDFLCFVDRAASGRQG
jgi:6-phosphogluconolactonase